MVKMANRINVLVTGGAGYIGSHTCKILAEAGHVPVVIDNLSSGHKWAVKWGPIVIGDLSDVNLIKNTFQEYEIGAVIHFAGSAYVGDSMKDPRSYFRNNSVNSLNLLEVMVDSHVNFLVYSSTCATYGIPEAIPIPEDHSQRPVNPYGDSKLFVERMLYWFGKTYGIRYAAPRYFNASGADPEVEIGEDHNPETHLIPIVIETALGKRSHVEIFGTDYNTPDGTAVRDFVHVTDLADAHLCALNHLWEGGESLSFNLGIGQGYSVREVIASVERVGGMKVSWKEGTRRLGDPPVLIADSRRAKEIFGWRPRFTNLDAIVETAWRWHESRSRSV